ncbi:MAG: 3-dehydroquinate synthase [Candidatus Omnitrophota bacterium]
MKKIHVNLGKRSYDIHIGRGVSGRMRSIVPKGLLDRPILVVTNRKIMKAVGGVRLIGSIGRKGDRPEVMLLPDSERAKSFATYADIIRRLSAIGKGIAPLVIALGGGVVGDVAGFAAATYRRGVPYVQMPTTLLAQVDSSIGGKVAIDLPQAKNLVGAFYQPSAVVADLAFLSTLPAGEMRNGMAEVIKYGVIKDAGFFALLESRMQDVLKGKRALLEYVVSRCASIKAGCVSKDEFDVSGVRVALNYGHTFAHAIETAFGYSRGHTHGESVAVGMVMAARLSLRMGLTDRKTVNRIISVIEKAGLPSSIRRSDEPSMMSALEYDKKFVAGKNRFVVPVRIGRVITREGVSSKSIISVIRESTG